MHLLYHASLPTGHHGVDCCGAQNGLFNMLTMSMHKCKHGMDTLLEMPPRSADNRGALAWTILQEKFGRYYAARSVELGDNLLGKLDHGKQSIKDFVAAKHKAFRELNDSVTGMLLAGQTLMREHFLGLVMFSGLPAGQHAIGLGELCSLPIMTASASYWTRAASATASLCMSVNLRDHHVAAAASTLSSHRKPS